MNFSEAVKAVMNTNGIKPADIARATGYSYSYIHDLLSGDRRWNEDSINKVCEAVGMKIEITSISSDEKEVEHEQIASN